MKTVITLLGASRRVGKDSAAKILVNELNQIPGYYASHHSFALALRLEVREALRANEWHIDVWTEDPVLKETIIRPLLIAWGQARRAENPDYWIERCALRIREEEDGLIRQGFRGTFHAVVSDWRFPNEATRFPLRGFQRMLRVHISRPGVEQTPDEKINDPLCAALADVRLTNSDTLDTWTKTVQAFLYNHLSKYALRNL